MIAISSELTVKHRPFSFSSQFRVFRVFRGCLSVGLELQMEPARVALVTGSGKRRIGWYVAQELGRRGYSLAIHYRNSEQHALQSVRDFRGRKFEAEAFGADLGNEQAVQEMVAKIVARFGRIDVLVNCAAIWTSKPLEAVTAADVREFFETNTLGTFLVSQQVGLLMTRQAEGGSVILLGDWAVVRPYIDYSAYFVSKGAIPTITRCLAVELGSRNPRVRVNCVMPGPVMLPENFPEEERERVIESTLVKREGSPHHVAQAVLHFVDNDFLTGTCLPVDGGRTVFAGDPL
jgi:pteridine reductase